MTLALIAVAIAVAAVVQVVSGFGFALVAAPVLVALTDPGTTVSVLAVLGVLMSVVTLTAGRERARPDLRAAAALIAWSVPGIALGALLLSRVPEDPMRLAVGVLVLAALASPAREGVRPLHLRSTSRARRVRRAAAGLVAGAMTTSTGLNGPPLALHLRGHLPDARALRDTLAVCFVALDLVGVGALGVAGELTLPTGTLLLPLAAIAGGVAGHRLFDRAPERTRTRATTAVLVASATTAIVTALI